jgi:hypothetical protein
MEMSCKNCGQIISNNFCDSCGQKKYKRIDKKYIWDELQYTILHTNKGLLYSVKSVIKNPGKTAKEFIDGNRVNHYKPILLAFVLSGIAAFISFKIIHLDKIISTYYSKIHLNSPFMADMMSFISSYSSIFMLLLIPIFAVTTKIAFRKWENNYFEHIIINAYILSFYQLFSIILVYPIGFAFRHSPDAYNIFQSAILFVPFLLIWFFKEFYKDKPLKAIILKVLSILGLFILGFILLMIISAIGGFLWAKIMGPESVKYIKPQ